MVKRFKLSDVKPASTPMPVKCQLDIDPNGKVVDQKVYRSMIGFLLYLCASRLYIMLSVGICARFKAAPKESHYVAVKRIFRYLAHTPNFGLWYSKEQVLISWVTRIQIGREIVWIGSQLPEGANSLVALW